jgi:hypothetical protein
LATPLSWHFPQSAFPPSRHFLSRHSSSRHSSSRHSLSRHFPVGQFSQSAFPLNRHFPQSAFSQSAFPRVGICPSRPFFPFCIAFSLVFLDLPRFSQLSQHFTRLQKKIALGVRTRLTRLQVKPTNHSARHTSSESDSEQQVLYAVLSHLYLI